MSPDPIGFEDSLNLYLYNRNNPLRYYDPDGQFAFVIPLFVTAFGTGGATVTFITAVEVLEIVAVAALGTGILLTLNNINTKLDGNADYPPENVQENEEKDEEWKKKYTFPENPDDLMPELPRDERGHIYVSGNVRIRPEKHPMEKKDWYNPRHHEQHYHVEVKKPSKTGWRKPDKLKPPNYVEGNGTGFLAGEAFPTILH
jgi:hypothetical protein